ncbi:MAG: LLM class flavin-dependent oxidoreductase, partial [Alphaproteobacteria bacterium]
MMRKLPVQLGLSLPNRGVLFGLTDIDTILKAANLAEESGAFASVWFGDSLIHKPRLDSIVMLSAAATRTRKVRLGVICMASFPVRHPVLLATQWAS